MKPLALLLVCLITLNAHAASLSIVVTELERAREVHPFRIDLAAKTAIAAKPVSERTLTQTAKYATKDDRHFWSGSKQLGRADDVLAQASLNGIDVLVVRREHNAFLNPLKFLSALSGHPIQVSEIWVIALVDEKEIWSERLVSKDSVYRWKVSLLE